MTSPMESSAPVVVRDAAAGAGPTTRPATWYEPRLISDDGLCYCSKPAVGVTRYWDGTQFVYRRQCADHLPSSAVVAEGGDV